MSHKILSGALLTVAVFAVAGCSTMKPMMPTASDSSTNAMKSAMTGVVQAIDMVDSSEAGVGVGTISGVAVSGMAGQRGATSQMQSAEAYRITLRMDDGSQQVFGTTHDPELRVGQRIQIVNGIVMHS